MRAGRSRRKLKNLTYLSILLLKYIYIKYNFYIKCNLNKYKYNFKFFLNKNKELNKAKNNAITKQVPQTKEIKC